MQSKATTVAEYLASLPPDRRQAIEGLRRVILDNLDPDYEEGMQYGMIGYYVPHRVFPAGYHCDPRQPLPFACLASQKKYMSLYAMSLYMEGPEEKAFRAAWAKTGKKLDMGKSCIRFQKLDDLALDVIADAIRRTPARKYIAIYQAILDTRTKKKAGPARKRAPARAAKSKSKSPARPAARKAARKAPRAKARAR